MKKHNLLIATLLVVAAISVAVVSCKKEKQESASNSPEIETPSADNMDEYLITFKKKLLSAQKGDETISLEQAKCVLCNMLNFDFGDANYPTDIFQLDTLHANLLLTNKEVDISQLAITYNTILDAIIDIYHKNDMPEKSIYTILCSFNDLEIKDKDAKDVEIVVVTRGYLGSRYADTNDWRAGNKAGRCDGYLSGLWGAPEQVVSLLNQHVLDEIPGCLFGERVYFTENANSWKDPYSDEDMVDPNSPCGYRLFFGVDLSNNSANTLPNTCILHNEIIYYKNQCSYLFNYSKGSFHNPIPNDHVVTRYAITYTHSIAHHYGWWRLVVSHAKPNCTGTDPIL